MEAVADPGAPFSGRQHGGGGVARSRFRRLRTLPRLVYEPLAGDRWTLNTLGVGIDLVDVQRVVDMLERKAERAVNRFLTDGERDYCLSKAFPAQHIAARIAAKEAAYKSLQLTPEARGIGWRDLEVTRGEDGEPRLALHGRAAEVALEAGVSDLLISLSHSRLQAAAVVIARG